MSEDEWELAVGRGVEAARDLPRAERFATLVYEQVSKLTLEHASCACIERRCTCSRFGSCSTASNPGWLRGGPGSRVCRIGSGAGQAGVESGIGVVRWSAGRCR